MAYYIGTKLVKAEAGVKDGEQGYNLQYSDGYISWAPKEVFEKTYLKVEDNLKLPSGVSVGPKMVDDFIKEVHVETLGEKTTLVRAVLVNGFEIIETSACVDATSYSEELGTEVCIEKIKDKIWYLLGFLLQTAYEGIK